MGAKTPQGARFIPSGKPLINPQQESYCMLRIAGHSRAKAYNLAYNKPDGHKYGRQRAADLEKRTPEIAERIVALQQQAAERVVTRLAVDNDYILDTYREIVERCMQSQPVLTRDGDSTGEYRFDAKSAVAALNSLSKINGLFSGDTKANSEEAGKNEQQLLDEYHRLNEQLAEVLERGDTGEAQSDPEGTDEAEGIPLHPIPEAG